PLLHLACIPSPHSSRYLTPPGRRRARTDRVRRLLDSAFGIPGTRLRFGLDGVLGLVPGIGDTVTTLIATTILYEAWRAGVRKPTLLRMGLNVAGDCLLGAVPLVGDVADFFFKANRRNLELARRDIAEQESRGGTGKRQA
ncbi:MAG: DUF4112 domain-containing protein, partial [Rhodospirillales bacterium]